MRDALIGYTGFVGSHLNKMHNFSHLYNSTNYKKMSGLFFNQIICAGVSAVKWKANKDPEEDRQGISALEEVLATVTCESFVLISTIDVYPRPQKLDESFSFDDYENHAYGTHRLEFEGFCKKHFSNCTIIRLPALFGEGLKKNIIFDLLNDNNLDTINPNSSFQYYDLENIWDDISKVLSRKIKLINLFTQPIKTSEIVRAFFANAKVGAESSAEIHYDLHTMHAKEWGKSGPYIYDKDEIMERLKRYIKQQRK